jgi:hypothetical protein
VQTLGHATSGTFPAGGPASASFAGGPGGGPPGGFGGGAPGGGLGGGGLTGGLGADGGLTGGFGGDGGRGSLSDALTYIEANGGGTLFVSGQNSAASAELQTGAHVAGLGGFTGRESQVSLDWLAERVASGEIRWVLVDGGGGLPNDSRTGSRDVMAAIQETCTPASGVDGLYDCSGAAAALAALA